MILVTGANGLVGSHVIKKLLQQGKSVRALYRTNHSTIADKNIEWFKGDILDVLDLEEAMAGILQVYHCAAMVSFSPEEKELLHKTNIEGTANVVNACLNAGVDKLLFVSSVAAISKPNKNIAIDETMKWVESKHTSEYAKSKYLAEMEVWRGIGEGLNAVIINPSIILGCSDWTKGSAGIFKSVYDEFSWYTDGVNGFVDVEDVVNAMIGLMESIISAERFIISGENISYRALFTQIAIAFNKKVPHKKVSPLIAEVVWRLEAVKAKFTGKKPLLTRETANTAQAKVSYNSGKLLQHLPWFKFTPLNKSIERICNEFKEQYHLQ